MDADQYRVLFEREEKHWFFEGQWTIADRVLDAWLAPGNALRILDAGCGTGGTSIRLVPRGDVFATDLSADATRLARTRGLPVLQAGIEHLPFADHSFDLATCFDVLYHRAVSDDGTALRELRRVLRPRGALLVRVPAFSWLGGAHDAAVHAARRYTRDGLAASLEDAGYAVQVCGYSNLGPLPLVFLKRQLERLVSIGEDLRMPPRALNRLLSWGLSIEAPWVARGALPFGVSVVAFARAI